MKTTVQFKLNLTDYEERLLATTLNTYIRTVNEIVEKLLLNGGLKLSSKDVSSELPSALKNQCIKDAKTILNKYKKRTKEVNQWNKRHPLNEQKVAKVPIMKRKVAIWNNQNYTINDDVISFPMWIGKSKRFTVKALMTERVKSLLKGELGTLRITQKNGKYMAQISVDIPEQTGSPGLIMGIDLGIKVPAVCHVENGNIKFFGNGRKNKYIRRHFKTKRTQLGKAKNLKAIKKLDDKESRIMRDIDHKISRQIVNYALKNKVSLIRLETLSGIRKTTRISRKNRKDLHTWSFYRLQDYIIYKAALAGIKVELINPSYTSQECPNCGQRNHAKDRKYKCSCGFNAHRDVVGAINIMKKDAKISLIDGNSLSA